MMDNLRRTILVLLLVAVCILPVSATTGTVTVTMPAGSSLTLYQVGELTGEGQVTLTDQFASSGLVVTDVHSPEAAQYLAEYAAGQNLPGVTKEPDGAGSVSFSGLTDGIYLVVQTNVPDGYLPIRPFLFSMPEESCYAIEATPKTQTRPDETQPESTTPQTGDSAAVLILPAVAGVLFSAAGLILCIRQRKHRRP